MLTLEPAIVAVLNRLLEREQWARERLAPFAGTPFEVAGPPAPALRFAIGEGGYVAAGSTDVEPGLVLTLGPGTLFALGRGEEELMRSVAVSGDTRLAGEILLLARHLRWDVEEDLSRVIGDVAAHRLVTHARGFLAWQRDAAERLAQALVQYAAHERRLVTPHGDFERLAASIAELRDGVERLGKRLDRLR